MMHSTGSAMQGDESASNPARGKFETPYCRRRVAHDASDHARNLSLWEQSYDQFSYGRFEGNIAELWLPNLQVFMETANQALHQSCAAWPDAFWFGLPCPSKESLRVDARLIAENALLFRPGGHEFELHTPRNLCFLGVVVGKQLFGDYLSQIENIDPYMLERRGALILPADQHLALRRVLHEILAAHSDAARPIRLRTDRIRALVLESLAGAVAAGAPLPGNYHRIHSGRARQLVRQACELVLSQPERSLSIADICRTLHVSRRSLQYAFQDATGFTPLAYLRTLKLNHVRRHLRSADDSATRQVTTAATTWGFDHLGQFSQDYRKLFGETPSTTLHQTGF